MLTSNHRLAQKSASLIFQLRVGHALLNDYLYHYKITNSARCLACSDPYETVEHFLLHCPKYAHERWPLLAYYNRM
jgi:hypothetical protein